MHDVVVVGAGFAGLAFAKRAAELGLAVVVLERQANPGDRVRTTGILVREACREWAAPPELVRRIRRVKVYTPTHRSIELERRDYFFAATDTPRLMRHLACETVGAGAEIRFGESFRGATVEDGHVLAKGTDLRCRLLVGADGASSVVAESVGLDRNTRVLKGVEWEFEGVDETDVCLHCFVDPECAPGYIGWVVPGVGITQVGLAVHGRARARLANFVDRIAGRFGLSDRRVVAKRGGIIPVGGLLPRFYRDRVLLIGDAAGMVSPLTAGGIHNAYRYGRIGANAAWAHLREGGPHPGEALRRAYPKGSLKRLARWGYDRLPVGTVLEAGILAHTLGRRVAGAVFFGRAGSDTISRASAKATP